VAFPSFFAFTKALYLYPYTTADT